MEEQSTLEIDYTLCVDCGKEYTPHKSGLCRFCREFKKWEADRHEVLMQEVSGGV